MKRTSDDKNKVFGIRLFKVGFYFLFLEKVTLLCITATLRCLRVTDFPPDANHGMYVPAAVLTFTATGELWTKNRTVLGGSRLTFYEEYVLYFRKSRFTSCVILKKKLQLLSE